MKSFFNFGKKNKKGVFGLTSVQQFFAIILGIALLAYVIVVIMGTLNASSILPFASDRTLNERGSCNGTGYTLSQYALNRGFQNPTLTTLVNNSAVADIANCTIDSSGVMRNATAVQYFNVTFNYTYQHYSTAQTQTENILSNTSGGITSFFASINPVYAILAILVIILVLVVLVRVVTGSTGGNIGGRGEPQL